MTVKELLDEINDDLQNEYLNNPIEEYEIVLRIEAIDTHTLKDLDFRNIDHETKTIQLITT